MLDNRLINGVPSIFKEEEFIRELYSFDMRNRKGFCKGGPVLYRKGTTCYTDGSDVHNLVIGNTGSMKTLRFVLPLIYSCSMAGESMVVVDPKGELVRKTGALLKERGYKTVVLNWRRPQESPDHWNPFDRVQKAYQRGEEDNAENYLNDLLQSLFFKRTVKESDSYWNEVAGQLARGISRLSLMVDEKLSMQSILEWRHEKLRDGTLQGCFMSLSPSSDIYQNLSGFMNLTVESTRSCIESTFDQLTGPFSSSHGLTEMMSDTTFAMEQMGLEPTAVFLVVPDEKTTYHFLATLFIKQCYESLLDQADWFGGSLPVRVNFILEEFCNMPKLEDFVPMLTAARSRKIRFHIVIQSFSQMLDKYGEYVSKTVMDNCGNLIYLYTREISFLEYISKLAGNDESDRPLLPISRLQHLKKNETVIFHDRSYPVIVQDIPLICEYPVYSAGIHPNPIRYGS